MTRWSSRQTVMLGYPLGMKMDDQVRRNDLMLYDERGDPGGPAMTWSMFAINWLDLGETDTAAVNFNKSYQWYTRKPFNVWTEVKTGLGASNFITGMGGFLQAVLFGYEGFRIELERVTFSPRLPPGTTQFRITGLKYLGASFDVLATGGDKVVVVVREMSQEFPLQLRIKSSGTTWRLRAGSSCPDVVRSKDSQGREPIMPTNIGSVQVWQTGGGRCGDFLQCSRLVQQFMAKNDTINFYIGDDNRIYQGSSLARTFGILKVAFVGDYTLTGMTMEQHALLRRLIKCGVEQSNIRPDYKLQFGAVPAEDCGTAPCAGNSLHCQLKKWRHWDSSTTSGGSTRPDCSLLSDGLPTRSPTAKLSRPTRTPFTTPWASRAQCPPIRPAEVTCNCQSRRLPDVSNVGARRLSSPVVLDLFVAAGLVVVRVLAETVQ